MDSEDFPTLIESTEPGTSKSVIRKHFITPKLVVALDSCQLSMGDSVFKLEAIIDALGCNIDEFPISSTVYSKPGRFKPELLKAAKKEFECLMTLDIICRSISPLSNPFHMVKKANVGWRSCGDYSCLNAVTVPNRYPVPYIQDCTQLLEGKTIFSTIDLSMVYNQIAVFQDDITKTEMTTVCLSKAGKNFQRFINLLSSCLNFCFPYFDDILIATSIEEENKSHLRIVRYRQMEYSLTLNASKCILGQISVTFLGCLFTPEVVKALPSKVKEILDMPKPKT
ncbi:Retrovirus-related Pol polyprotein from transposon opus [Araneus ventricosus]|uniref:Retrovirus-related Pol polyprotein from transposon opus n=1 Tax=Araneus ventricosus TaxID=182803 RepID=A0A4Y2FGZ2_ARAVE|nr:Retrovirus-related Pol polyprotein from transposon opus [Araneus ventricosus]